MSAVVSQHGSHWDVACDLGNHTAVNMPTEEDAQAWADGHDAWHTANPPATPEPTVPYTPTTGEMRFAWADRVGKHNQEGAQEFDRWLATVRAEAWDAGHAAHDQGYLSDANPYQEDT